MQGRSRMAAWAMLAATATMSATLGGLAPGRADAAGDPAPAPSSSKQKGKVKLNLHLIIPDDARGVEVEVKPGSPACRFKPVVQPVRKKGNLENIPPFEVETVRPDRECSFLITLKEPGQPDREFRRNIHLAPAAEGDQKGEPQLVQYYLTSTRTGPSSTPVATKPSSTTRQR